MKEKIEYPFSDENTVYIDARHVRILMRHDDQGRVEELIVVKFIPGGGRHFPMELYKKYPADLGNCMGGWLSDKEGSLEMAMLEIGYINGFADKKTQETALLELAKIKECWQARCILYQMGVEGIEGSASPSEDRSTPPL